MALSLPWLQTPEAGSHLLGALGEPPPDQQHAGGWAECQLRRE